MLKRIILLIFATLTYAAEISNIQVQQRTDGSGIIDVTYDLIDAEGLYPSFNVSIEMSINGGEYSTLSTGDLSGDVGENVIPGSSRSIQIQAPGDTYSDNVVIKILASATVVSGELPFTMISISSIEGVSSYQGETIDYNFQMMQYELTNADLVTFLETYDFETNEVNERIYDCNDYTEYFNTGGSNDGCQDCIYGCTEMGAMNYNASANIHTECIYEHQVGCTDPNASNYLNPFLAEFQGEQYDDCSCFYSHTEEVEDMYSWVTMPDCNWTINEDDEEHAGILASFFNESFTFQDNKKLIINLCDNEGAQNFPHALFDTIMNYGMDSNCFEFLGF